MGRAEGTLRGFFDLLGPDRCAQVTHVSADAASWVATVVAERCPNAVRGADPYHVVAWATEALDAVRREVWNEARGGKGGRTKASKTLKGARWALWRNPSDLTVKQRATLDWIATTHPRLHRAWALKEGLRMVFRLSRDGYPHAAKTALDRWISWARRCRIPTFVKLARRVVKHRAAIEISIDHRLSNALAESVNTKMRLITRQAFGFHDPHALIGLAMLGVGGLCPPLPTPARPNPTANACVAGRRAGLQFLARARSASRSTLSLRVGASPVTPRSPLASGVAGGQMSALWLTTPSWPYSTE